MQKNKACSTAVYKITTAKSKVQIIADNRAHFAQKHPFEYDNMDLHVKKPYHYCNGGNTP